MIRLGAIHHLGDWQTVVTVRNSNFMLFSNNDVILRSEGEGVKNAKNAVILNVWSLIIIFIPVRKWFFNWSLSPVTGTLAPL